MASVLKPPVSNQPPQQGGMDNVVQLTISNFDRACRDLSKVYGDSCLPWFFPKTEHVAQVLAFTSSALSAASQSNFDRLQSMKAANWKIPAEMDMPPDVRAFMNRYQECIAALNVPDHQPLTPAQIACLDIYGDMQEKMAIARYFEHADGISLPEAVGRMLRGEKPQPPAPAQDEPSL